MFDNVIIIPYRDREKHLEYFIENSVPLIEKYLPNTKILVVEQNIGKLFNRGMLLNIGFNEYKNKTKYFFTQDVDHNPNEHTVSTKYTIINKEVVSIRSPHKTSLGCVIKVSHDSIFNVNGFPNNIWGWGIEDRALYFRYCIRKIDIINNLSGCVFDRTPHKSNAVKYTGEKEKISNKWTEPYISILDDTKREELILDSGLNNLEYNIIERKLLHNIVELIKVDI